MNPHYICDFGKNNFWPKISDSPLLEDPADEEITLAQLQKRKKRSTTNQCRCELDEQFLNAEEHAEDVSFTVEHAEEESDSEDEEPQKNTKELSQKIGCESVSKQDHMLSSQWHSQATIVLLSQYQ